MIFTELTAAMWDGRQITLVDHTGREITGIPVSIGRSQRGDGTYVVSYAQHGGQIRADAFVRFDSFDSH
jgi:hypothetical protein